MKPLPRSQGHVLAVTPQELWWLRRKVDADQDPARGYSLERGDQYINAVSLLLDKIGDYAAEGIRMREIIQASYQDAPDPGTEEALKQGCQCPAIDNCYGKGYRNQPGVFIKEDKCPLHGKKGPKGS